MLSVFVVSAISRTVMVQLPLAKIPGVLLHTHERATLSE
jgi:hypothetical protein